MHHEDAPATSGPERHVDGPTPGALAIAEDLCRPELSLADVGARHDLSPASLARWAACDANARLLHDLATLIERRSRVLTARARERALRSLLRLASDEDHAETARKACVDLLNLELPPAASPCADGPTDADPAALHDLLERLGRERLEADDPAHDDRSQRPDAAT